MLQITVLSLQGSFELISHILITVTDLAITPVLRYRLSGFLLEIVILVLSWRISIMLSLQIVSVYDLWSKAWECFGFVLVCRHLANPKDWDIVCHMMSPHYCSKLLTKSDTYLRRGKNISPIKFSYFTSQNKLSQ